VGGFGAGSDFSWQVVGTYGFDTSLCGTPFHAVLGYRALAVDYSENGKFGKNGIDFVQTRTILVDPSVPGLNQIQVGDQVVLLVTRSVAVDIKTI
jgi:hypothetical protein